MKISVIIPAHNEEKYIGSCLEYLLKYSKGRFCEIIVIDNASTDRTADIAKGYPGVRVISEPRKGTGHARQTGFESSVGDFLAYFDADTRLREGWIDTAEKAFRQRADLVCLSGPYHYYDGKAITRAFIGFQWRISMLIIPMSTGYAILGGNFMAKRQALTAAGGFDRSIKFYGDDMDLAKRLSGQGKVLFRSDFWIYSSLRRFSTQGVIRTLWRYAINFIWPVIFGKPFHDDDIT